MKKRIMALFLMGVMVLVSGCVKSEPKKVLNVLNWDLYIDPDVLPEFEKEFNCKVNYDLFEQNEDMYAKVKSGAVKYDVIFASDYMIDTMIHENMLEKIDHSKLKNYEKIDEAYRTLAYDPTGEYSIPYVFGNIGIGYNKDKVSGIDSWNALWDEKYKGQITMLDASRFTMSMALIKAGKDVNTTNPADLEEAKNLLIQQKPLVRSYVGDDQAKDILIAGDSDISCVWGGEALLAMKENPKVGFTFPKEGAIFVFDTMAIPTTTQNKELAEEFIDFMCRPDISARNATELQYATPISEAKALMDKDLQENTIIFPDAATFKKGHILKGVGDFTDAIEKAWTEMKSK